MPKQFALSVTIRAVDQVSKTMGQITQNVKHQQAALRSLKTPAIQSPPLSNSLAKLGKEFSSLANALETKAFFAQMEKGAGKA